MIDVTSVFIMFHVAKNMEAQETVANLAMAYSLGKMESSAAINLLHKIPKEVVATLTRLVRSRLNK